MLCSTHKGLSIYFGVRAGVLTQPTPTLPLARPARADLALGVGCVSRAGKHLRGRGATQHNATNHTNPFAMIPVISELKARHSGYIGLVGTDGSRRRCEFVIA